MLVNLVGYIVVVRNEKLKKLSPTPVSQSAMHFVGRSSDSPEPFALESGRATHFCLERRWVGRGVVFWGGGDFSFRFLTTSRSILNATKNGSIQKVRPVALAVI